MALIYKHIPNTVAYIKEYGVENNESWTTIETPNVRIFYLGLKNYHKDILMAIIKDYDPRDAYETEVAFNEITEVVGSILVQSSIIVNDQGHVDHNNSYIDTSLQDPTAWNSFNREILSFYESATNKNKLCSNWNNQKLGDYLESVDWNFTVLEALKNGGLIEDYQIYTLDIDPTITNYYRPIPKYGND